MKHFSSLQQVGGGVQAVGVQYGTARKAGQERLHQRPGLGSAGRALGRVAQTRPQQKDGRLLALDAGDVFRRDAAFGPGLAGAEAALRQAGRHRRQHRFHAGQRDDARTGAQSALHRQRCRAPVAGAACHGQHSPEGALVAVPRAGAKTRPNIRGVCFHKVYTSPCK